jgi:hypothetical protein
MINWTYNQNDFKINENKNTLIPEGDHRVVVSRATIKTYSSGNEGFEIMLDVSGYPGKLWHRIILDPANPDKTNHNLGKFFESFGITNYDLNDYESWAGKDGAVRVKHDEYNGSMTAKVLFCITRAYQAKLPAWGQPAKAKTVNQSIPTQSVETLSTPHTTYAINNVPVMPNEHVPEAPSRQRKFDGFLL